jgi:hypothetical protein
VVTGGAFAQDGLDDRGRVLDPKLDSKVINAKGTSTRSEVNEGIRAVESEGLP